jgi:hypothetical protein
MKQDFRSMPTDDLVREFARIAGEQDQALMADDYSRYNRLFDRLYEVKVELKERAGDQRHALIPLCEHKNALVQLQAAIAVLKLAPELARQTLQLVKDRKDYPASAEAYGMLRALEQGTYVPD